MPPPPCAPSRCLALQTATCPSGTLHASYLAASTACEVADLALATKAQAWLPPFWATTQFMLEPAGDGRLYLKVVVSGRGRRGSQPRERPA